MPQCAFCGRTAREDLDIGYIAAGVKIPACRRCYKAITRCAVCGKPITDTGREVEGLGVIHHQCFAKLSSEGALRVCDVCHRVAYTPKGKTMVVDGRMRFVGADCLKKVRRCTLCGEKTTHSDGLCALCAKGRVRRYSHKPKLNLTASGPLYGIEVEVTGFGNKRNEVGRMLYKLSKKEKNYWLKADSSIGEDGIEIVSAPRTMRGWIAGGEMLADVMGVVQKYGYVNSHTGMHIHRSKRDLTHADILKLAIFMYKCRENVYIFAGRNENTYAQMENVQYLYNLARNATSDLTEIASNAPYYLRSHYSSLSAGGNGGKTLELRVFASTVDPGRILANIAFYHYMVQFVKTWEGGALLTTQGDTLWARFVDFVGRKPYKSAAILSDWL